MKFVLSLLIVLLALDASASMRTLERWKHLKTPDCSCRIIMPEKLKMARGVVDSVRGFAHLFDRLGTMVKDLNCTNVYRDVKDIGVANETGSYDGFIGYVQRNEADFGPFVVRSDALPGNPGKLTSALFSGDLAIISFTEGEAQDIVNQIVDFLDLELPVLIYAFMSLFFCICLILVLDTKKNLAPGSASSFLWEYLGNVNSMFNLLLGQDQITPRHLFGYILALVSSLFVLFGVIGILLNTVGANLVVKRLPSRIDSLDDLFSSKMVPLVLTNLPDFRAIQSAPEGTKLHLLKERIREESKHNSTHTVRWDASGLSATSHELSRISQRRAALILAQEYGKFALQVACLASNSETTAKMAARLYSSSDTFGSGMITTMMSHKIHPYTEKLFSNLVTALLETGQQVGLWQNIMPQIPEREELRQMADFKYDSRAFECLDKVPEHGQQFIQFSMRHMGSAFTILIALLAFATLVLLIEIVS